MNKKGKLFVVGTPIGHLEDITLRALNVLKQVEAIACEDTRQTIKLLNAYGLKKRLISYYHPKENQKLPEILSLLNQGKDVALVSDAGMPGISDPGFPLIREAINQQIEVVPVPGPSAVTAALSASGLPTHRFLFLGFPPVKRGALKNFLSELQEEKGTMVFYLPIRRLRDFLQVAAEVFGNRRAVIARELTKVHEEFIRGNIAEISGQLKEEQLRGECTVLIEGKPK
ncbi:MAG: 16S rRNA (cytidine(1402)-2'-O)-methyltransferase [Candidatus Saccharicenans sp.]